jgi:hypothetical protein
MDPGRIGKVCWNGVLLTAMIQSPRQLRYGNPPVIV